MTKKRINWTDRGDELRAMYPNMTGDELAEHFGCARSTVTVQANKMGLQKSPEFMAAWKARSAENARTSKVEVTGRQIHTGGLLETSGSRTVHRLAW